MEEPFSMPYISSLPPPNLDALALIPGYPSYPLNPSLEDEDSDVRERGRLKFSADSIDFFCDEARSDARLNGTVLHGILSGVIVPSDLPDRKSTR